MNIDFELIDCNADRDPGDISELEANIKEIGLLQPILLRRNGERYRIVDGRRLNFAGKPVLKISPRRRSSTITELLFPGKSA